MNEVTQELIGRSLGAMAVINRLQDGATSNDLNAAVATFFPSFRCFQVVRPLITVGAVALCRASGGRFLIISQGVTALTSAGLLAGWQSDADCVNVGGFNSNSYRDGAALIGRLLAVAGEDITEISLYGHSGGGVLVETIGKLLRAIGKSGLVAELVTFGAPKAVFAETYLDRAGLTRLRWMIGGDPVPTLPFQTTVDSVAAIVFPFRSGPRPDRFDHGSGGMRIGTGGHMTPADDGLTLWDNRELSLVGWLTGQDAGAGNPHAARTYLRALNAAWSNPAPSLPTPAPASQPIIATPQYYGPTYLLLSQTADVSTPQLGLISPIQVESEIWDTSKLVEETAMGMTKIDSEISPKVFKVGDQFSAMLLGQEIAVFGRKSRAVTFCRHLGKALKYLGNAHLVNVDGFPAGISNYLGEASMPNGPARPALALK